MTQTLIEEFEDIMLLFEVVTLKHKEMTDRIDSSLEEMKENKELLGVETALRISMKRQSEIVYDKEIELNALHSLEKNLSDFKERFIRERTLPHKRGK